jgi:DNA modification methylase
MTQLEFHEYANSYPMMTDKEFDELCADIQKNGYRPENPIVLFDGLILDGRNRYKACEKLNILPMFTQFSGCDEEAFQYAKSSNLTRKHWTIDQWAMIALDIEAMEAKRAKERMLAGVKNHPVADRPQGDENGKSRDKAGKAVGVSGKKVQRAKALKAKNKKLAEKVKSGELPLAKAERMAREEENKAKREKAPAPVPATKSPRLIVASADNTHLGSESVDVIITSPPYNLGKDNWAMGGNGRTTWTGIEYSEHKDTMKEGDYQKWQIACLQEMYRVAKPGASLFYNHKVRQVNGGIIHPLQWLQMSEWTIRQEIIWDRGSTHNHVPNLFWQHDERIYWMTKGKPTLPDRPIGKPSIIKIIPSVNTWHPAPFSEELPKTLLEAVGRDGITVLDPFAGSCTTLKIALEFGYNAIGVDISSEYLETARKENGWIQL